MLCSPCWLLGEGVHGGGGDGGVVRVVALPLSPDLCGEVGTGDGEAAVADPGADAVGVEVVAGAVVVADAAVEDGSGGELVDVGVFPFAAGGVVDALNVEGVVKSVAVQHGELTICMLGVPDESGAHPVVQFSFKMEDVQDFSAGERPMLHRLEWREHEGFAYALRFTGGNGSMSVDEAVARVKARGGSCWGVEEAAECERLLGERFPLTGGKLL